ncbi:unnamed protein product [Arabidopsis halleri]
MAAPRNLTGDGGGRQLVKEEESAAASSAAKGLLNDDSPTGKRTKSERFPLPRWEFAVFFTVFLIERLDQTTSGGEKKSRTDKDTILKGFKASVVRDESEVVESDPCEWTSGVALSRGRANV